MTYRLDLTKRAQEDIDFHKKSGNKSVLHKIAVLLNELTEHPLTGTGNPNHSNIAFPVCGLAG